MQYQSKGKLLVFKAATPVLANTPASADTLAVTATAANQHTWHRRLGHIGHETLTKAVYASTGILLTDREKHDCDEYAYIKIKKHPYRKRIRAKEKGALVYIDSVPRIRPTAYDGSVGYTTLVDDASLRSDVRFFKSKQEIPSKVEEMIAYWETKHGVKVRAIRTDNKTALS